MQQIEVQATLKIDQMKMEGSVGRIYTCLLKKIFKRKEMQKINSIRFVLRYQRGNPKPVNQRTAMKMAKKINGKQWSTKHYTEKLKIEQHEPQ